jgi:hypothetical protein
MKFSTFIYALLVIGPLLQLTGLVMMIKRKIFTELPTFALYTIFTILMAMVGVGVNRFGTHLQYFYFFWIGNFISVALGFGVIREVYANVLQPYQGLRRLANMMFGWSLAMLAVTAIFSGVTSSDKDYLQITNSVIGFEKTVRFVQIGLILFLFAFSKALALSWKHYTFGIALGFGVFAGVNLIIYGVRSQLGPLAERTVSTLTPTAFFLATIIWVFYLVQPAPVRVKVPGAQLRRVEEWDLALRQLMRHP